ncbi:MAG: PAS domain S-box protein [Gemmatimonadota bacterium]
MKSPLVEAGEPGSHAMSRADPCGEPRPLRRARLLDRLLAILVPLGLACAAVQWWSRPAARVHFLVVLAAAAVAGVSWILNRMNCYREAGVLASLVPTLAVLLSLVITPSEFIAFAYPTVGVLLAALLLSVRAAVTLTAVNAGMLLLVPLIQPAISYPNIAAALGFNVFVAVLVVAGMRNLEQEEEDRRSALRASEERWRSLITGHPNPTIITESGRCVFANAAFLELLGAASFQLLEGRDLGEFAHPDAATALAQHLGDAHRGAKGVPLAFRLLRGDGTQRRVEASSMSIAHGGTPAVLTVLHDVTDRWLDRQRLEESEARYRSLVEHAPEAIAVLDGVDGRWLDWNRNAERLFGRPPESLRATTAAALSLPVQPSGAEAATQWAACVRQTLDQEACDLEWWFQGPDGAIPCEVRLVRIPGSDPPSLRASITDITERKRLEAERRQAETKLRTLIEQSTDLISVLDADRRIVFESPSIARILGYSVDELLGRDVLDVIHPDDAELVLRSIAVGAYNPGVPRSVEIRLRHKDGSWRTVEAVGQVLAENVDGWHLVVHSRDITDRQRLEAELLRISNREQRRLGRDLHDGMGQVLVGARLYAAGVERSLRRKGAEEADGVHEIGRMLDEAHELARALARGLNPVSLEGGGLISALEDLTKGVTRLHGIECPFRVEDALSIGDLDGAAHLYRIAQEALTNATLHAQATRITVSLRRNGEDTLVLTVRDNGTGIVSNGARAHGMGVPIMRKRASMLGGTLEIRSDRSGTEVCCSFPAGPFRAPLAAHAGGLPS